MNKRIVQFEAALRSGGVGGGLRFLNESIDHRYTAVYRLNGSTLRNVGLHDKAGEVKPEYLDEVPLEVSFCQFVMRDGVFATHDSSLDDRLDGHPYKGVMMAYHGVPVLDNQGELFGTLCHFDVAQRDLSDDQFELLKRAAKVLPPYLLRL